MNSAAENLDTAKRMFMDIVCAFYTDAEYIIADYLVRNKYLREDDVQNDKLLLHHKRARQAINKLLEGALIKSFNYHDRACDTDGKLLKNDKFVIIYYINYDDFINVVILRLHRMYQVQVSNEIFNRSCEKERLECVNPGCKKRYTIIEAVQYFSEERKCYVCRFCGRELAEIPNQNEEEEDIQAMQNKIKEQMEEEEPYRTSLLGYIRKLSGITIHFEDPEDSITKELREASMTGMGMLVHKGGFGGGGGRSRNHGDVHSQVGLEIDVLMDNGGDKSVDKLAREMESLPAFLVQSTVSETVKRHERQMRKKQMEYSDDDACLSTGKGLFDS